MESLLKQTKNSRLVICNESSDRDQRIDCHQDATCFSIEFNSQDKLLSILWGLFS